MIIVVILYGMVCIGVLRLRTKRVAMAGAPFVAPGGTTVALAAAMLITALLWTLAWSELAAALALVAVSAAGYSQLARRRGADIAGRTVD